MRIYTALFMRKGLDGLPENFKKEYATKTKKDALFFINTMTAIVRDGGKIPYNMMY